MADLASGYLVFVTSNALSTVHSFASQIGRLKSDAQILDVGLLASNAWLAVWTAHAKHAEELSEMIGGLYAPISANAIQAMFSLGPGIDAKNQSVGILEILGTENLKTFFHCISECEKNGWTVLEIRIRKSGPSGAHAFFANSGNTVPVNVPGFLQLELSGDYRKFF